MAAIRVLVVDDNPTNLKLLSYLLIARGYEVYTAADGPSALTAALALRPQLVLVDIQLPGMDGLAVTQHLKAEPQTRDAIVIAVTASAMQDDEARARAAGCDDFVTKPINTKTLPELLTALLTARGLLPE